MSLFGANNLFLFLIKCVIYDLSGRKMALDAVANLFKEFTNLFCKFAILDFIKSPVTQAE